MLKLNNIDTSGISFGTQTKKLTKTKDGKIGNYFLRQKQKVAKTITAMLFSTQH